MRSKEEGTTFFVPFLLLQAWIAPYFPSFFDDQACVHYDQLDSHTSFLKFVGSRLLSRSSLQVPRDDSSFIQFLRRFLEFDLDGFKFFPYTSQAYFHLYNSIP